MRIGRNYYQPDVRWQLFLVDAEMGEVCRALFVAAEAIGDLLPTFGGTLECGGGWCFASQRSFNRIVERTEIVVDTRDTRNKKRAVAAEGSIYEFASLRSLRGAERGVVPGGRR